MAETIKGINVVIGSETTGLSAALSDVNKKSRDIQSELKQVERLLKMDPGNTELLAQKQKLLADSVANTKEKLDRLKVAQEQVNQQFASGKISEGQYRAFQREIAKTEQDLERFEGKLKSSSPALEAFGNKAKEAGEKLNTIGNNVKGAGEKMSAGITAPIIAAGAVMTKGALDAESAQGKLQASLGVTEEEAKKLSASAEEVWKSGFGENIGEATNAITIVRQNMKGLADSELAEVTKGAMTIADVFGEDVNEVAKAAGVAMKNFGISGQEALDVITYGFQNGGNYSGELLDTIREYSPQFASLGLTADQAMGMLIKGAEAGAWNLDKVGDAMKEFNIRAQDGSKTTAEGFTAIGLNAGEMGAAIAQGGEKAQGAFMTTITALANMKDPLAQNQAGVALFGTQWEDVRSQVIVAMADGVNGINNFKGSTQEATNAIKENNPGMALKSAFRELQDAVAPALQPVADFITNSFIPAITALAEGFANLSPGVQSAILIIAGIVAAIGPILVIIGQLIISVGAISTAFAAASGAITAAGGAMAIITGPVGIAIAAITALAAAAYIIISNWGPIKDFFINLWQSISEWTVTTWNNIKQVLSDTWTSIKTTAEAIWTALVEGVKSIVVSFIENIKTNFQGLFDGLQIIFEGIKTYFTGVWELIKNIFLGAVLIIIDLVTGDFENLKTDTEAIFNNLKEAFGTIWEGIKLVFEGALKAISGLVSGIWNTIKTTTSAAWEGIKNTLSSMWESLKTTAQTIFDSIKDTLNNAVEYIKGLPAQMTEYGKNIIQGLIDGIKSMIGKVKEIMEELADAIKDKIKGALGIHSPSRVMMEYGVYTGEGFALGIQSTIGEITNASNAMAKAVNPNASIGSVSVASSSNNINGSSGINQTVNIYSPTALSPAETARQNRRVLQELALQL